MSSPKDPNAHGPAKPPKTASIITADGDAKEVPLADLPLHRAMGSVIVDDDVAAERKLQDKYGTALGQAEAAGAGALRGLTAGLSDVALTKLGVAEPETLKGLEEANPYTSTTSEILANIAPLALSGGTSAAAKIATTVGKPVLLFGQAGEAVGGAVAKQFIKAGVKADSAHILAKAAARGIPQAVGSAAEGALYGATQALSEDALGEPGSLAEKVMANVSLAAMMGGGVGAVAGLATGALAKHAMHAEHELAHEASAAGHAAAETHAAHEAGGVSSEAHAMGETATKDAVNVAEGVTPPEAPAAAAAGSDVAPTMPGEAQVPTMDPSSPEALRQLGQEAEVAAAQHGVPPTAEIPMGSGHLEQELASATGVLKGADAGFMARTIERMTGIPIVRNATENLIKASASISGHDQSVIRSFIMGPDAKRIRGLATGSAQTNDKIERAMAEHLNLVADDQELITEAMMGAGKFKQIKGQMLPNNQTMAVQKANDLLNSLDFQLNFMSAEGMYNEKALNNLRNKMNTARKQIDRHVQVGGDDLSANIYKELDELKRRHGDLYKGFGKDQTTEGRFTRKELSNIYKTVFKPALEDESVWGKMAVTQKAVNDSWHGDLNILKYVSKNFTTEFAEKVGGEGKIYRADPEKIKNFMSGLVDPKSDLKLQQLRQHLGARKDFLNQMAEHVDLTDAQRAAVVRQQKSLQALNSQLDSSIERLTYQNQLKTMMHATSAFNQGGAGLGGFILGGPLGAAIGLATGSVVNPGKLIHQLAVLDKLATKTDSFIGSRLDDFLGASMHAANGAERTVASGTHAAEATMRGTQAHGSVRGHVASFAHKVDEVGRRLGEHGVHAAHIAAEGGHHGGKGGHGGHGGHHDPGVVERISAEGDRIAGAHKAERLAKEALDHEPAAGPDAHRGEWSREQTLGDKTVYDEHGRSHHASAVAEHEAAPGSGHPPLRDYASRVLGPAEILVHAVTGGASAEPDTDQDRKTTATFGERVGRFTKMVRHLRDALGNNLSGVMDRLAGNTAQVNAVAPNAAMQMTMRATMALGYLNSTLPQENVSPLPAALRRPVAPTDSEMAAFERRAATVNDPMSALNSLAEGRLSHEQVDALKNVYPDMYQSICDKTMERLTDLTRPVSYAKKTQLGILLGVPLDATMAPSFLQFVAATDQANAGSQDASPAGNPGGAGSSIRTGALAKSERSSRLATRGQEVESVQ